jgi:excinuclease UvrABC helicase subunit UvrB
MMLPLERGQRIDREQILRKLVEIQYDRNDHEFARGAFRVRGDIVEVYPSYEDTAVRIELFGDEVDELISFDPLTGTTIRRHDKVAIYPEVALRDAARSDEAGRRDDQGGTGLVPRVSSRPTGRSSRRTGSISGRCSTWR